MRCRIGITYLADVFIVGLASLPVLDGRVHGFFIGSVCFGIYLGDI